MSIDNKKDYDSGYTVTQNDIEECLRLLELIRVQIFPNDNTPDQPRDLNIVMVQEMLQFELRRIEEEMRKHDQKQAPSSYMNLAQDLILAQAKVRPSFSWTIK